MGSSLSSQLDLHQLARDLSQKPNDAQTVLSPDCRAARLVHQGSNPLFNHGFDLIYRHRVTARVELTIYDGATRVPVSWYAP